jgi:hypothetical protein
MFVVHSFLLKLTSGNPANMLMYPILVSNTMPGELAGDAGLSAEEEIVRVMKSIFDRLTQEIATRFLRLKDLNTKFGFLLDVKTLLSETDVRRCTSSTMLGFWKFL